MSRDRLLNWLTGIVLAVVLLGGLGGGAYYIHYQKQSDAREMAELNRIADLREKRGLTPEERAELDLLVKRQAERRVERLGK